LSVSPDEIQAATPAGPEGPAEVRVENEDGTSAAVEDGYAWAGPGLLAPAVTGVSHGQGPTSGGDRFWIHGRNFAVGAGVCVGGVPCPVVEVVHGGLIRAAAPPGPAGFSEVRVINPGGVSDSVPSAYEHVALSAGLALVRGRARYERRQVLERGLSGCAAPAPIPWSSVELRVETSPPGVFACETDRWGYFSKVVDSGPTARVRVNARAAAAPSASSVMVLDNATDRSLYAVETDSFALTDGGCAERDVLAVAGGPIGVAGAFHLLAACTDLADRVQQTTGRLLPLLRVFWEPGNAYSVWSSAFYTDDLGAGPVPCVQILGGLAGVEEWTDTDEFDTAVVAHEFGHFVQSALSTDSSPGGTHGGELLVPNLAFSEGFASWFGCAASGSPWYRDTTGRGASGSLLLYDGVEGAPDGDADGLAAGFAPVLSAVVAFDPARDFPCLQTFFDRAVEAGTVTPGQVQALARSPEDQSFAYPPAPGEEFPAELPVPGSAEGFVDARNPYHPADPSWRFWLASGGGNPYNALNGANSRRYFRFRLPAAAEVTLTLTHHGDGRYPGDLGLYLLDLRHRVIDLSDGGGPVETIRRTLPAGSYIAEVRGFQSAGSGYARANADGFTIEVE
jgi:hypothetical protein